MPRWITELMGNRIMDTLLHDGWTIIEKKGRVVSLTPPDRLVELGAEEVAFTLHPEFPHSKERVEKIWNRAKMTEERYATLKGQTVC